MNSNATGSISGGWRAESLIGARFGTCVLERPLGVGGMGAVYLARQERPRRQVAVKVLHPQLIDGSAAEKKEAWGRFLARFRREADAAAALDHANIVPIYEFGEAGEDAYIVMPYLADGSLAQWLEQVGPLPVPEAIAYATQIAAALDHAHAHGLIHRDVKPSNLLLHPDGRLLLADFGLAHAYTLDSAEVSQPLLSGYQGSHDSALTLHGMVMGTPEYMAPEQIRREPVGPAADIYSLGMVTYAMLTGWTPFADDTPAAVFARQLNEPPAPIRPQRPDVSAQVESVIFWALAKDPAERPTSAGEFARALQQASTSRRFGTLLGGWRGFMSARPAQSASFGGPGGYNASAVLPVTRPPRDATIVDRPGLGAGLGDYSGSGGQPLWPGAEAEYAPHAEPRHQRTLTGLLVGGALVVLVAIVVLAGVFANDLPKFAAALATQSTPTANVAVGTVSPTATPSPRATATPRIVNALAVSTSSVKLCTNRRGNGNGRSQTITLTNKGGSPTNWYATVDPTGAVSVQPNGGSLGAGSDTSVTISAFSFSIFGGTQQASGTITFAATGDNGGQPATVRFTVGSCDG